ncbi:diacylglycerol kinase [Vibrio ruber]|uniref:Diacylglycerol kinase n=1 Tax=Vibrio ruber (strain DSM 16370 / JCM 11486 / BCRC 17186 / CECT 7878 / LMG 23124 / VR1) TaxID=1123498 RepID=A0A1R4LFI1_VIBR1|nr:diacylglycerol kinase [Vibrio ruber]WNJ97922.1 diacylglycerol kinase [Vibrio ruber]SJN55326.1 Diacylglycerol kinase [Vibrio ruber DSM 16370]
MKASHQGLKRVCFATVYSVQGLRAVWLHEAAFRQEVMVSIPLIILTFWLNVTSSEQMLMITSLILILIAELFNSAVEAVVDRIGDEFHELSGRAKDIGSAAVLITILLTAFIWTWILV